MKPKTAKYFSKGPINAVLYCFVYALGLIPRKWSFIIADAIGGIWYALDRRHREIAVDNMTNVFGREKSDEEIRRLARTCLRHIARIPFEMGWSLRLSKNDFMRHCKMKGLLHLKQAYAKDRGVLILTLHIGNWELLPMSYIASGFKVSMIYRPLDFEPADRFVFDYRSRHGGQPIPKKKSMRKILKALKNKECVGILLDQTTRSKESVLVDFLGRPAWTNKGLALMAQKTRAPVIPSFLVRRGFDFEVHIGPEIPLIQTGQKEEDIRINTLRYNEALDRIVRQYPEQWLWVHRRWRKRGRQLTEGPLEDGI